MDRSKKRDLHRRKALVSFSLCFAAGFVFGFFPPFGGLSSPQIDPLQVSDRLEGGSGGERESEAALPAPAMAPKSGHVTKLLIVVTTTRPRDPLRGPMLDRLSRTLRLVPPPILWIVVGTRADAVETAAMLRRTGVMCRHLFSKENYTEEAAEVEHQKSVALEHIERHHLDGIVHFAELSSVYDLQLFDEMRETEVFGTWPVALVSASRKQVIIEGPTCKSSLVLGWHLGDIHWGQNETREMKTPRISISSFAFNSSILWNPDRWRRLSFTLDSLQKSTERIPEFAMEDQSKILAFPSNCSRVLLWNLHVPKF